MRILDFQNYPASVKLTNLQQKAESSTLTASTAKQVHFHMFPYNKENNNTRRTVTARVPLLRFTKFAATRSIPISLRELSIHNNSIKDKSSHTPHILNLASI